ncbi:MAG: glucosamine-6-phosphate deaminase [Oscillospiraceae bacterium]|nr:glucosamine-6-phosphate deaminase [Oscillospiraceae bacterium]
MALIKEFKKDKLAVKIFDTRAAMGAYAAAACAKKMKELLAKKSEINMIFAAAPSQNEFLKSLYTDPEIDFSRINAFHMDEYVGLAKDAPQGFGNFLRDRIFSKAPFKSVSYLNGLNPDIDAECARYSKLLADHPVDIVCMGIGENGHIAFNDPHVAFFNDPKAVKVVELDLICRQQQVNDGCFKTLSDVPTHALTLTIPTLFSGKNLFCMVPAKTKANAVFATVTGDITEKCPASILRRHDSAILFVDGDSGSKIL